MSGSTSASRPQRGPKVVDCPQCGGAGYLRWDVPLGHPKWGKIEPCDHPSHAEARVAWMACLSNLTDEEQLRRLSDIVPIAGNLKMLAQARRFLDQPRGWLYIYGSPGNGKTEVAIALVNELNAAGRGPAMYVKFTQLLNWMRKAFNDKKQRDTLTTNGQFDYIDGGYVARFERVKGVRVLVIDELDKARMTEFASEFEFDILDERWRSAVAGDTATVLVSNSHPREFLPNATVSRVEDGRFVVVENQAGDGRASMRWGDG